MSGTIEPAIVTSQLNLGNNLAFSPFAVAAPTFTPAPPAQFAVFNPPPAFAPSSSGGLGENAFLGVSPDLQWTIPVTAGALTGSALMAATMNPYIGVMGGFAAAQSTAAIQNWWNNPTDNNANFGAGGGQQ